ncbi:MAG: 3-oxoacyl-[acyl-carrier protein] reductase [Actinomycetota bacterium]|nr:3-oxoacyl-[acyl-carrier protein] reductase [Actinomycetota bacterium]
MELGLQGRVAVVSGGSRGIGRAIATRLADEGANVVLAARNQSNLDEAAAAIEADHPGQVAAVTADMTDPQSVRGVIAAANARFGPVSIAVSNVIGHVIDSKKEGAGPAAGTFGTIPHADYREEFTRLLQSAWALADAAIPDMRAQGWGRIVNIGSGVAREPTKDLPHVLPNTVRPAVAGMYRILARRLAAEGVTVNSILTGSILTERNRSYWEWLATERGKPVEEVRSVMTDSIPARRMGEPHELAAVVTFLCSDRGRSITGQSIPVDGGINRHL